MQFLFLISRQVDISCFLLLTRTRIFLIVRVDDRAWHMCHPVHLHWHILSLGPVPKTKVVDERKGRKERRFDSSSNGERKRKRNEERSKADSGRRDVTCVEKMKKILQHSRSVGTVIYRLLENSLGSPTSYRWRNSWYVCERIVHPRKEIRAAAPFCNNLRLIDSTDDEQDEQRQMQINVANAATHGKNKYCKREGFFLFPRPLVSILLVSTYTHRLYGT